jgi:hypothetical protein
MHILGWKCVWKCFFLAVEMVSSAIRTQDFLVWRQTQWWLCKTSGWCITSAQLGSAHLPLKIFCIILNADKNFLQFQKFGMIWHKWVCAWARCFAT